MAGRASMLVPAGRFRDLFTGFSLERLGNATMSLAIAQAGLDRTVAHVQERKAFGKPIIEFQATQMTVADMVMQVEAARGCWCTARPGEPGAACTTGAGAGDPAPVPRRGDAVLHLSRRRRDQRHGS